MIGGNADLVVAGKFRPPVQSDSYNRITRSVDGIYRPFEVIFVDWLQPGFVNK